MSSLIIISSLCVPLKSSQNAFTCSIFCQFHIRTSPLPTPGAVGARGPTLIKALCPIQDWRKSNGLRECPEERNKNWLNRPSEERLRELGLFQLELLVGGIIHFQKQKTVLQNSVVTVGYSTENSREGMLMIFLFGMNKLPLLLSLPTGL